MSPKRALFAVGLVVLLSSILIAQVVITSTVVGTVTDPQGATVPGARVTLKNVDTGVQWTASTNSEGNYQFPNLIAGHYTVDVVKDGFSSANSTAIPLENGTTQRMNIALKVGGTPAISTGQLHSILNGFAVS